MLTAQTFESLEELQCTTTLWYADTAAHYDITENSFPPSPSVSMYTPSACAMKKVLTGQCNMIQGQGDKRSNYPEGIEKAAESSGDRVNSNTVNKNAKMGLLLCMITQEINKT